jgi:hypothetical protein
MMEVGDVVEVNTFVIKGKVVDTEYNKDEKCLQHLVEFKDEAGDKQNRWFKEDQLKVKG